jgi:hypothetical protein
MRSLVALIAMFGVLGCTHRRPAIAPTTQHIAVDELDALCDPPAGWRVERHDQTAQYNQNVWVSPSGYTSYGVVRFKLPLPVGDDLALAGFVSQMRQSEGWARLVRKQRQDGHLAFIAEGGRYHVDGIIVTSALHGWVVYAGTLQNSPVALDELELAVHARENTALGLAQTSTQR